MFASFEISCTQHGSVQEPFERYQNGVLFIYQKTKIDDHSVPLNFLAKLKLLAFDQALAYITVTIEMLQIWKWNSRTFISSLPPKRLHLTKRKKRNVQL